jgi:hypothetical protein
MPQMNDKTDDNLYLNIVFSHNPFDGDNGTIASYSSTKNTALLDKASDYYCSIIRFVIPLRAVPLLIMPVVPNSGYSNITTLIIGVSYLGIDYPQNVIFVPDSPSNVFPPVNQNQTTQVITPYYYIYAYSAVISMINKSLHDAYVASGSPGGGDAPFFYYDPSTQLISLYVSQVFINSGAQIFINEYTSNYLDAFHFLYLGANQPNGKDYVFILSNTTGNPSSITPYKVIDPVGWLRFIQEYNVINYWESLRKVLITSNSLPIKSEYIQAQTGNGLLGNDVNATLNIITDFVPSLETAGQSRTNIYYYPTSQYRLVDMISDTPVYKVDFNLFWEDLNGNLYPIYIPVGQSASIKVGFFRKNLYKPMNLLMNK